MTPEEDLIQRYFDAFNRHDIEGVMACFHDSPRIVDPEGKVFERRAEVQRNYETAFALMPDCRCDLRSFKATARRTRDSSKGGGGVPVGMGPGRTWHARRTRGRQADRLAPRVSTRRVGLSMSTSTSRFINESLG